MLSFDYLRTSYKNCASHVLFLSFVNYFLLNLLKEIISSQSSFFQCYHVEIARKNFQNLNAFPMPSIFANFALLFIYLKSNLLLSS